MALQNDIFNALSYAASRGYRVHPDAFAMLKGLDVNVLKIVQNIISSRNNQSYLRQVENSSLIMVEDVKSFLQPKIDEEFLVEQQSQVILDSTVQVNTGEGVEGYTSLFRSRMEKSLRIFSQRPGSKKIVKISSIKQNSVVSAKLPAHNHIEERRNVRKSYNHDRENAARFVVAGLLMARRSKKNGLELVIDDYSGSLGALAKSEDLKSQAVLLALDQAVMLEVENDGTPWSRDGGGTSGGMLTVKSIVSPDIPDHIPNKSKSEAYAVLISDLHIGSKHFMESEFARFLDWLSSDEDDIVRKIRFLCLAGDLVDGIGIFPDQDKELVETDALKQLRRAADLLARVPKHIHIFMIPGNHDPGRRALPQPALPKVGLEKLYALDNCTMLGNPALVELNGVKVLMYHGQSLDDIIATTPGLSYSRPAEAMKMLLKARHLSPIYGGRTPIAPECEDMLVITDVPDVLHSGHVHVVDVVRYRSTLIVNSGAWQNQTKFQQTMGITPTPGIAVVINLATLELFGKDFNEKSETQAVVMAMQMQ